MNGKARSIDECKAKIPLIKISESKEIKMRFVQIIQYHLKFTFGLNDSFKREKLAELYALVLNSHPTIRVEEINNALNQIEELLPGHDFKTINGILLKRLLKKYKEKFSERPKLIEEEKKEELNEEQIKDIERDFLINNLINIGAPSVPISYRILTMLKERGIELRSTEEEWKEAKKLAKLHTYEKKARSMFDPKTATEEILEKVQPNGMLVKNILANIVIKRFFTENDILEIADKF